MDVMHMKKRFLVLLVMLSNFFSLYRMKIKLKFYIHGINQQKK